MRRRISIRGCVRLSIPSLRRSVLPSVRPSVGPSVRPSVPSYFRRWKERILGASFAVYPALFYFFLPFFSFPLSCLSFYRSCFTSEEATFFGLSPIFLDASSHIYKRVCLSVCLSVRPSSFWKCFIASGKLIINSLAKWFQARNGSKPGTPLHLSDYGHKSVYHEHLMFNVSHQRSTGGHILRPYCLSDLCLPWRASLVILTHFCRLFCRDL